MSQVVCIYIKWKKVSRKIYERYWVNNKTWKKETQITRKVNSSVITDELNFLVIQLITRHNI